MVGATSFLDAIEFIPVILATEAGITDAFEVALDTATLLLLSRGETRRRSVFDMAAGAGACAKLERAIFGELG